MAKVKILLIIQVIICLLRVFGITFGGIQVNSNGHIFFNKYIRYYGYFINMLLVIHNIFYIIGVTKNYWIITTYVSAPGSLKDILPALFLSLIHINCINTWSMIVAIIKHGQKTLKTLIKLFLKYEDLSSYKFYIIILVVLAIEFILSVAMTFEMIIYQINKVDKILMPIQMTVTFVNIWANDWLICWACYQFGVILDKVAKSIKPGLKLCIYIIFKCILNFIFK